MTDYKIPFNWPYMSGWELKYIAEAHSCGHLAGDGSFTKRCHTWLERQIGCRKALLTPSCTAALEMMALLLDIEGGDEVILPSFTFVSTANAFVLRGGVPVFVDIRPDTLNIDETRIEDAITSRTKAIAVVHYAGVGCEMDAIMAIASRHGLAVIEDAAQGAMGSYRGRALGSIGDLGALSFHETKNLISGEGGALLVNSEKFVSRAEILRDKGTDRSRFIRNEVDKYTWQDKGSSYLPNELTAAFLWAQFEDAERITNFRLDLWNNYHESLAPLERRGLLRRPIIPEGCAHNAHMYYVLLPADVDRATVLAALAHEGINAVFHYVPLHDSPAGRRYGRANGDLIVTNDLSSRLIRLPMWVGLPETDQNHVVDALARILTSGRV
ncbi:dTDP-4-amino-4,6-dideoxygalactose transaminase [Mycobacterium sp. 663a-19]|uniref:dTDP-4-amino-4,6-dideoxygalactose transaminase n=1 Tax=Mycobacterium sp. 663a-19 TaxID=2986148 RepID=UPI002D1E6D8C|nr:dTDP-4-amino-4,6-dideoxygalactose transaminase [Mycobacterium sp. 663a-19]MEB3983919.1 dTDP-4-amino-4,6-dideoxygalactose transaminase [Mycobacterium sp. 663a-19]